MEYVRFCESFGEEKAPNSGRLIEANENYHNRIKSYEEPYYVGNFKYKQFYSSIVNVQDVTTNKLWWDFDSKDNLDLAKSDTDTLLNRLVSHGIYAEDILVCFSGYKGFYVEVITNKEFSPSEVLSITKNLAKDLSTFDERVYNASRIFRVPGTKHPKSGLYRTVIDTPQFNSMSMDAILKLAETSIKLDPTQYPIVNLPDSIVSLKQEKEEKKVVVYSDVSDIDFSKKPKGWSNCKWAMSLGYGVKENDRNLKRVCLAATCHSLNYTENQAYYHVKNAVERGVERYGGSVCSKEDIWHDVKSVYNPGWKGGTFSCKNGKSPWLTELCESLGPHKCKSQDLPITTTDEMFAAFRNYATDHKKNTITTGIQLLDDNVSFMVGTSNAILAGPASGKTSLALSILNHNSLQDSNSIFFSYDMFRDLVYLRLIQKHFGIKDKEAYRIFHKDLGDAKKVAEINETLLQEYRNVDFCFKAGQTAEELQETIRDVQERRGKKVKLVVVDYNELVVTNISDPTQSSAQVAQKLRQIANEEEVCVITLLQPAKVYANPAEEIKTYQGAKGSGAIAQSVSLMLGLSRPGFGPKTPENDKYITISALKNRHGPLYSQDFSWDGLTGKIRELNDVEERELHDLRAMIAAEKNLKGNDEW